MVRTRPKPGPESFRLSQAEIESCMSASSAGHLDDIRFAQAQVRNFTQAQRAAIPDTESETLPGAVLGHKKMPVESVAGVPRILACATCRRMSA